MNTNQKLRKSAVDRKIDGICGGIAEYFGIDSTMVRILCVLLGFAGGVGIVLYFLAMILMPSPDLTAPRPVPAERTRNGGYLGIGVLLMAAGIFWFLRSAGILSLHSLSWFSWKAILPVILIVAGVALILKRQGSPISQENPTDPPIGSGQGVRRLYRSRIEKKIFGVCGGLGEYFRVDPVIVRILFVAFLFLVPVFVILSYLLLSIFVREEPLRFAT